MKGKPVTDPAILAELNGTSDSGTPVTDPELLAQLNSEDSGFDVPAPVKLGAKMATLPGRGMRGIGVGLEQLMLHPTQPASALNQAAQAVQPGFSPGPGQRLGSFASGFADPINLAMNAVVPGGSILKSVGSGAAMGLGSNLLDQASQGNIRPADAAISTVGGGIAGAGAHTIASTAAKFLEKAPTVFSKFGMAKAAIQRFIDNPLIMENAPVGAEANAANVRAKSADVTGALDDLVQGKTDVYDALAKLTGTKKTVPELEKFKAIPPDKIESTVQGLNKWIEVRKTSLAAAKAAGKYTEEQMAELDKRLTAPVIKTIFDIRSSIGKWMESPGIPDQVKKGLTLRRHEINSLLETMPGGELFRSADKHAAQIMQVYEMLSENLDKNKPGKTIKWLTDTFSGKHPDSSDNLMHLAAMEKLSGHPVVDEMWNALTKAQFSQPLAGNMIKRSLAGASPFLISAMMRIAGIPFQLSLPMAAGLTTAAQSPAFVGGMIRGAQKAEPYMQAAGKGMAVTGLNALRQLMNQQH